MRSAEIRTRFLAFFERHGHLVRPSSPLVPADDPTLLFTNAGMVQFKKVFLGLEEPPGGCRRAVTSQKCVRAGGKHNDLEQVGHTARHHTFFEMLGNFSFGDYFKRDAIGYAWQFVTEDLAIPREHVRVTVFHEDDEARALWKEIAGLPDTRIYGLGARDNFWQMADTGPCGPCSEIYVDLAALAGDWAFPDAASGEWTDTDRAEFSFDAFVEGAEAGRFLEIWNLVFMQFDRQADGTLVPLPQPSVDTGAGLERIAAVLQGVTNNFHTDLFRPLLEAVEQAVGFAYPYRPGVGVGTATRPDGTPCDPASFRVLADHARAVAFLLADGVFPSNEGRGYVLRRILRRAVRHAWLLGRHEPTLMHVVRAVVDQMHDAYPELKVRRKHIEETTRAEEERFLATVDAGMARFDEVAPVVSTQGSPALRGTVSGRDAFTLYDTFGFPIDLTQLMARERGYTVDLAGFEAALDEQRKRSQAERRSRAIGVIADDLADAAAWTLGGGEAPLGRFVGYDQLQVESVVTAVRRFDGGRVAVMLAESPFYAESGGQVSDHGEIQGDGWRVAVDEVRKVDGRIAAIGVAEGEVRIGRAVATVPAPRRRATERNHTATHLLHAALRRLLGEHVHQAGSLVAPDRLRFDFTTHGPVGPAQLEAVEAWVNEAIWGAHPVVTREMPYKDAIATGAMALFGEKYGDVVRVVDIPGLSTELCGGTHVRSTAEIGAFRVVHEGGVAAGVRRIEAVTGEGAYRHAVEADRTLARLRAALKVPSNDVLPRKVEALAAEVKALEKQLADARKGSGADDLLRDAATVGAARLVVRRVAAPDVRTLQALGDTVREQLGTGVGVLGAAFDDGKASLVVVVSDDLRAKGISASELVKAIGARTGARGGGKPHLAQAGFASADALDAALPVSGRVVHEALAGVA